MTTVYVVTAGSGDTYHIERIYLDSQEAYGFAQAFNGIAPVEPVQVEEWQTGDPPAAYDGQYWRAEWWARIPDSKRRSALRDTDEGERFDDFAVRQEWWTGEELPDAQAGAPRTDRCAEDRGHRPFQGQSGRSLLGRGYPGQGRPGGDSEEIISVTSGVNRKQIGMAVRHFHSHGP